MEPGAGNRRPAVDSSHMDLARNLERRLERLVEGLAGRLFRGPLGAAELASRIVREADLAVSHGPAGPVVPNAFELAVNPANVDVEHARPLTRELGAVLAATAVDRGWRLEGAPQVTIVADPLLAEGSLRCAASVLPGEQAAWARLVATPGDATIELRPNRALVGRSEGADAVVPDAKVSRFHALVWREGGEAWVADLDSANGTFLNGRPVTRPEPLRNGDTLRLGPALFEFQAE